MKKDLHPRSWPLAAGTISNPKPITWSPAALLLAVLMFAGLPVSAQITGGQHVFQFLSLSPSARITALGGMQITVRDDDAAFAAVNPAALNPSMDGQLVFNHNFFLTDIQHGYAAFATHLPRIGFTMHGGLQYMNYGKIPQTDVFGNIQGEIKAAETAFTLGGARQLSDRFSLGLNLRFGVSTLDVYQSTALAADAGVLYADTARRFTAAMVLRNYGAQISKYTNEREDLPFDLQIGFSKRLRYLPFRLTVIAHHLHQWEIRYDDPALQSGQTLLFGDDQSNSSGNAGLDNFFRHFTFSGEFLLGRNESFRIRLGYNHLRKQELSVENYRSLAGFSGGVGVKVRRFRIDVGYAAYHLAGGVLHFGIGTNLKEFF
ncbi:MAG: type IX secretion system protein PorQ [Bacteroidetes bacterium]|nr:MAG: type IX secretion system protein PorQ [Bacteroidota bacterium]